jgi:hypothetical protein
VVVTAEVVVDAETDVEDELAAAALVGEGEGVAVVAAAARPGTSARARAAATTAVTPAGTRPRSGSLRPLNPSPRDRASIPIKTYIDSIR